MLAVTLLTVSLALTACGSSPSSTGDDSIPRCRGGKTVPLGIEEVRRVLKEHGLPLHSEQRSDICSAADVRADLTNLGTSARREGLVGCTIREEPVYIGSERLREERAPGRVSFVIENVECSVYPHGDGGRANVVRVRQALRELARIARQRT
jgi:hypothetical protein